MSLKQNVSISLTQKVLDSLIVLLSWAGAFFIRFYVLDGGQEGLEWEFIKIGPFLIAISIWSYNKAGLYRSLRFSSRYREIFSVLRGNTSANIGFIILLYFFNDEKLSRLTLLIYFLLSSSLLIITRIIVRNILRTLRAKGKNLRHILLVGNSPLLLDYVHMARTYKDSGIRFIGWIDSHGKCEEVGVKEIKETYDELKKRVLPDSIIISYQGEKVGKASSFIAQHYNDLIPIQILPDLSYSLVGHQVEDFGGIPLIAVNQPTFSSLELFLKTSLEFLFTFIGLILISPFLCFIAIGVKISSPGPILFGQKRVGLDGKEFTMWKFRSMKLASSNEDKTEWSNENNPRKTKFGDFIRRTSLDEFPQLLNVLLGDMSLVGPRPERPFFVEKFRHEIPGYMLKHKMKPGMTGWAQVNGWRGDTDLNKRIECDIYYIKHWSLWFDIKILFLTIFKGFINKNAY